jgi:AcrR family transcriptional regulator
MNDRILAAAARVLRHGGASGFNTNRISEVAGVSVGSLYQYYPNKESILFQLQLREAKETWDAISPVLADTGLPPRLRVRRAVAIFFASETKERRLRSALRAAAGDCERRTSSPPFEPRCLTA